MIDAIPAVYLIAAIAFFTLAMAGAGYIFSRALFNVAQTLAFLNATITQAKTSASFDAAKRVIDVRAATGDGPSDVPQYSDDQLRAAARASRNGGAQTGEMHIPGYDDPPPASSDDIVLGDERDGARVDDAPVPPGGHYAHTGEA
jgi:hypothetical protein